MKNENRQRSHERNVRSVAATVLSSVLLSLTVFHAHAELGESRVFSVVPPGEHVCVAVQIEHDAAQALTELRWLNNDDTVQFPRLLLLEATEGVAPDLNDTGLILYELTGEELDWGEATLDYPVQSSTGLMYAVFVFPEDSETTALGSGGGPGIGVDDTTNGIPFYISHDGIDWVQFSRDYQLAIEPQFTTASKGGGAPLTLKELAEGVDYWEGLSKEPQLPKVKETRLYPATPNPFNPRTTIAFDLAQPGKVRIKLYDVRGRLVNDLVDKSYPSGRWKVIWEGTDDRGKQVASGVYYLQMEADRQSFRKKLVLVR